MSTQSRPKGEIPFGGSTEGAPVSTSALSFMRCHCCGHHRHGVSVLGGEPQPRLPYTTLDLHCHLLAPEAETLVAARPQKQAEAQTQARLLGAASAAHNAQMRAAIGPRLSGLAERLSDMARLGIDVQVLSPSPTQYYPWADSALAADIAAAINRAILAAVRAHPGQFLGFGAVALQHPQLACDQLGELMRQPEFRGVEITSDPTGRGLDDPRLEPFWHEAERLGAVVFIHPLGTSLGERVNRHYLSNIVGQPLETTIALSELIFGSVLDRHPGLRICAAHGGGYLPLAAGRSDHGHGVRPEAGACRLPPSEYLRAIWYDTVVFRPDALRQLADTVGTARIVAGTDYPFDMGEYALHGLIQAVPGLSATDRAALLGLNAVELLGLPESHPIRLRAAHAASAEAQP